MDLRRGQAGMTIPGILAIMIMVGFFIMCAVRMAPPYFEYLSVRDIIQRIALNPEIENEAPSEIRRRIETIFNTNQIYALEARNVEIFHRSGKLYIDSSYEVRVPIMWRIDAVLNFNDLMYEAGNPEPLLTKPAKLQ